MTHHKLVSDLSHIPLQQVKEVKAQVQEIRCLSALVKEQQEAIKSLSELASLQSSLRTPRASTLCSESRLDVIYEEIFNLIPGTVNTR